MHRMRRHDPVPRDPTLQLSRPDPSMKQQPKTSLPVEASDDVVAPLIDRIQRGLPDIIDLPGVLGLFLVMIDLSRPAGTFSLEPLRRVVGPLDQLRAYIEALENLGLISIGGNSGLSHEKGVVMICDRRLLDVWQQSSIIPDGG